MVWWGSTFDHTHKTHRRFSDTAVEIKARYRLNMLHGPGYKKNVSLRRLLNHYIVGKKFAKLAARETKPDVVMSCLPTLDLCSAAADYCRERSVPLVIDIRDMWPDIMVEAFPNLLRSAARGLALPMYRSLRKACRTASGITGMTQNFVNRGLHYAGRKKGPFDRDFPFGYQDPILSAQQIRDAENFWNEKGVNKSSKRFTVSFIGSLSRRMELKAMIQAGRLLEKAGRDMVFVICGKGEEDDNCRRWAGDSKSVLFPGWIGQAEIWTLMQRSSVGIIPYPSTPDFQASIPNKAIEYMAGGLPILSSVNGVLARVLSENQCGLTYPNNNPTELANTVIKLHENNLLTRKMADNARKLFDLKFRADKVYTEMSEYLETIAETYGKANERH